MRPVPLHASTLLAHAPAALLAQLTGLAVTYGGHGHTLLFALSANFPRADDLQAVVHRLDTFHCPPGPTTTSTTTSLVRRNGRTVGCLMDAPPGDARLSCAVAVFDAAQCVPFRSTLAGRVQPQVGRWHAFRKQSEVDTSQFVGNGAPDWGGETGSGAVDWESVWSRSSQSSAAASFIPQGLQSTPPSHVSTLLAFSAPHPDALTRALLSYISQSPLSSSPPSSLTLTAAPTHFITGRPVTLFLDGEIYGDGAVGLALLRDGEEGPRYRTEFVGVKRLGEAMRVTSREGNMINALDDSNPTRLLLDAAGLGSASASSTTPLTRTFKEDAQFALGVLDASGRITQTYKITAGDPAARGGSLALDASRAPVVGSVVQFLHCPSTSTSGSRRSEWTVPRALLPSPAATGQQKKKRRAMAFMTVPEPTGNAAASVDAGAGAWEAAGEEAVELLEDVFVAASAQGFVVSQGATEKTRAGEEVPWTCSLPGSVGVLEW